MRLRQAAYFGWNTISQRGWPSSPVYFSRLRDGYHSFNSAHRRHCGAGSGFWFLTLQNGLALSLDLNEPGPECVDKRVQARL